LQVDTVQEAARSIPVIDEADVVVAGGGPAGVSAAVSAARAGADVLLVERYGHLGGLATGGLVILLDCYSDRGKIVVKGFAQEVWQRLEAEGCARPHPAEKKTSILFDPEALKYVYLKLAEEAGVRLLLHSWVAAVVMKEQTIEAIVTESKSGRRAVRGRIFVDATGDADLAAWAGAPLEIAEHPIGVGLVARLGAVDWGRYQRFVADKPEEWRRLTEEYCRSGGVGGVSMSWRDDVVWNNNGVPGNGLDVKDLTRVETTIRQKMWDYWRFYREHVPGFENSFLLDTAGQVGVRETRRPLGRQQLTMDDVTLGRSFPDSIGVGNLWNAGGSYDIPYQALLPQGVTNLLVSGRCISVDHRAHDMTRTIPVCMVSGQGAGVAAALAAQSRSPTHELDLSVLQNELRQQQVNLTVAS
jgi:glycine/D-amino acid oxidase-like deaminating enzyme